MILEGRKRERERIECLGIILFKWNKSQYITGEVEWKIFFEIYKKLKLCLIFFVVLVSKTKKTTNNFKRDHHSRPDFMINDKEFVGIFTMWVCVCVCGYNLETNLQLSEPNNFKTDKNDDDG